MKKRMRKPGGAYAMFAALFAGAINGAVKNSNINDPLKGIDIESEYKLIQDKKSRLSRAKRDLVVIAYKFNKDIKAKDQC